MHKHLLCWAVLLCLLGRGGPCAAQRTLQWEKFYSGYTAADDASVLIRPGVYVNIGLNGDQAGTWTDLRLVFVQQATGDTLRVVQLHNNPAGTYHYPTGAVVNPDRTLTVFGYRGVRVSSAQVDYTHFVCTLDTLGVIQWQRLLHPGDVGVPGQLLRTPDGYLLTANRAPYGQNATQPVARLTKLDRQGNVVWERDYPGRGTGGIGAFNDVIACPDGGYVAAGFCDWPHPTATPYFRRRHYLVKLRPNGDTVVTAAVGVSGQRQEAFRLTNTPGNGVALAGVHVTPADSWRDYGQVVRLSQFLQPQWTRDFVPSDIACKLKFVYSLADGRLLTGGYQGEANGNWGGLVAELSASGVVSWSEVRQVNRLDTRYYSGLLLPNGTLALTGYSTGVAGNPAYLVQYAPNGLPFAPPYCQQPPQPSFAFYAPTPDSLVVLDTSRPGPPLGVVALWHWDFGDGTPPAEGPALVRHRYAAPPAAGTPVTLTVTNNLGCTGTVTLYPFGAPTAAQTAAALSRQLQLFPNPAAGGPVTVRLPGVGGAAPAQLQLLDALGRVVRRQPAPVTGSVAQAELATAGLPAGVYVVRLTTGAGTATRRLIVP